MLDKQNLILLHVIAQLSYLHNEVHIYAWFLTVKLLRDKIEILLFSSPIKFISQDQTRKATLKQNAY